MPNPTILAAFSAPVVIVVVIVIILLFGGSKIPELARGLAKARKEFKKATEEVENELECSDSVATPKKPAIDVKAIEEEERAKIRARIEAEERAKIEAEKKDEK